MVLSDVQIKKEAQSSNEAVANNAKALAAQRGIDLSGSSSGSSSSSSSGTKSSSLRGGTNSSSAFGIIDDIRAGYEQESEDQARISQAKTQEQIRAEINQFYGGTSGKTAFEILDDIRAGYSSGSLRSEPKTATQILQEEIDRSQNYDQWDTELIKLMNEFNAAYAKRSEESIESQKSFWDKLGEGYTDIDKSLGGFLPGGVEPTKTSSFMSGIIIAGAAVVALLLLKKK